jgi:hypothetical protein
MMRPRMLPLRFLAVALAVTLAACSRGDPAAKHRLFAPEAAAPQRHGLDPEHPAAGLDLSADEVAARLGSFEWTAAVEWSVTAAGGEAPGVRLTEQHRVRQSATGDFEVRAQLDPGQGTGETSGKQVVYSGGMTYARALPAPFRQRPTDRGRDARRFREDSFGLGRSVLALIGPGLALAPAGGTTVLGREAQRFRLSLQPGATPAPAPPPAVPGAQASDPDTQRRQAFLSGRHATAAEGELVVDAATGAPLRLRLTAAFAGPEPKSPAVAVDLAAEVKALGGEVLAVAAPEGALPDERKPAGPSTALENAGLKKHGEERPDTEPGDEGE